MTDLQVSIINLQTLINEQAEQEHLWFAAEYITEAGLQQALRAVHSAAEDVIQQLYLASKGDNHESD